MATLSFEGESHDEIVAKVRRWLASTDTNGGHLGAVETVERVSELTKDALSLISWQRLPNRLGTARSSKA